MTERIQRILRNLLIVAAIILVISAGYFSFQHFFRPDISVEKIISIHDPVILKIQNPGHVIRMLMQSGNLRGLFDLKEADTLNGGALKFLDSLFTAPSKSDVFDRDWHPYLVFTDSGMSNSQSVLVMNLGERKARKLLRLFYKQPEKVAENHKIIHQFYRFKITEYRSNTGKNDIYTFTGRGLLMLSSSRDALETMVDRTMRPVLENYPENLTSIAGKECDANLFLNLSKFDLCKLLPDLRRIFLNEKLFGNHAVFDLTVTQEYISLAGFAFSGPNKLSDLFSEQDSIRQGIWDILPSTAASATALTLHQYSSFISQNLSLEKAEGKTVIQKQDSKIDFTVLESGYLRHDKGITDHLVYLRFDDKNRGIETMTALAVNESIDPEKVAAGNQILEFNDLAAVLPGLQPFAVDGKPIRYGVFYGDFMLLAENNPLLQSLTDDIQSGNLITKQDWFQPVMDRISESSNLTLYVTPDHFRGIPVSVSGNELYFHRLLSTSKASCFQVSGAENGYYVSLVCLMPGQVYPEKTFQAADSAEKPAHEKPELRIILPQGNNNTAVAFFTCDEEGLLSAFDRNGDALFQTNLQENLMAMIFTVAKPDRFLFNTASYLYSIKPDGTIPEGFPKKLPEKASNGIAVIDYENNNNYRILYCGADNRVYNLDINGKPVKGFQKVSLEAGVDLPVQHVVADQKDFLIITGKNGQVTFLNRKGELRLPMKEALMVNPETGFYPGFDAKKGIMFTLSDEGQLVFINNKGEVIKPESSLNKKIDRLKYFNFTGDSKKELVFLSGNEILVTDQKFRQIFIKEFEGQPFSELNSVVAGKQKAIALFSDQTGKLHIFNDQSHTFSGPFEKTDDFEIFFDRHDNHLKLITLKNNNISVGILK